MSSRVCSCLAVSGGSLWQQHSSVHMKRRGHQQQMLRSGSKTFLGYSTLPQQDLQEHKHDC